MIMRIKENTIYRITDMEEGERPRERLARYGAAQLSNPELLAILLRVGVEGENAVHMADRILNDNRGLIGLYRTSYLELCDQHGIGPAKAAQLLAAIELGKRVALADKDIQRTIHGPQDVYDELVYDMLALDQEELRVLIMDTRNHILEIETIYKGSVNSSQVRIAEVFKGSIRRNATSIIIVHNHPSGDPSPSPEDIALTRAIIQAGKLLDIDVLDHIVIGHKQFVSMKEKGFAFQ
jgi:DNA repair protein RadC